MKNDRFTIVFQSSPENAKNSQVKLRITLLDLKTVTKGGVRVYKKRYSIDEIQKALNGFFTLTAITTWDSPDNVKCVLYDSVTSTLNGGF